MILNPTIKRTNNMRQTIHYMFPITHRRIIINDPYQSAAPVLHAALHAVRPGNSGDRPRMS